MRRVIDGMVAEGAADIVLECETTNAAAIRLYERLGFLRDKRLQRCARAARRPLPSEGLLVHVLSSFSQCRCGLRVRCAATVRQVAARHAPAQVRHASARAPLFANSAATQACIKVMRAGAACSRSALRSQVLAVASAITPLLLACRYYLTGSDAFRLKLRCK